MQVSTFFITNAYVGDSRLQAREKKRRVNKHQQSAQNILPVAVRHAAQMMRSYKRSNTVSASSVMERHRQVATPVTHLLLPRRTPAVKEISCPDLEKFDLKGDHQPFIRACERLIRLRQNPFPTEKSKIF